MLRLSAYPYPTRSTARAATLASWFEAELRMVCGVRSRRGLGAEAEASAAARVRVQHQHQQRRRQALSAPPTLARLRLQATQPTPQL
eukprot:987257-Rhodomonas_salina.1